MSCKVFRRRLFDVLGICKISNYVIMLLSASPVKRCYAFPQFSSFRANKVTRAPNNASSTADVYPEPCVAAADYGMPSLEV